jgi:DNA-binding CsgD family transcriptional regulator
MENLINILKSHNKKEFIIFLNDNYYKADRSIYNDLVHNSKSIAVTLKTNSKILDRALIICSPGIEFVTAYVGCIYGGINSTSVILISNPINDSIIKKLHSLIKNTMPSVCLTSSAILNALQPYKDTYEMNSSSIKKPQYEQLVWINIDETKTKCETSTHLDNNIKKLLTKRETDVAAQLILGKTAKETARHLAIAYKTVEQHLESIKKKLSCKNKFQLVSVLSKEF